MSPRRLDLLLAAAVFVAAVAVAWLFWSLLPAEFRGNQSTDYATWYEPVARSVLAGEGISLEGELTSRYPPGFPVLLAGVFGASAALGLSDDTGLLLFRMLCAGLSAVLVFGLARLVWRPGPALLAAAAWLTYPFGLWLTKQPNSEVPFIPALYAALFVFWLAALHRPRSWGLYLLAGALVGAAMLIRPSALLLGPVLAFILLLAGRDLPLPRRLGMAGLLLGGALAVVLPWEAAVYRATGEVILLSSGGAITIQDGLTFLAVPKEYRAEVAVPADVEAMMWRFHERRPEMGSMGAAVRVILDEAAAEPLTFAHLQLIKAGRSWYGIDSRRFEAPVIALQAVYLGLIVWGSVVAWRRGGGLRRMTLGHWLVVAYFWAMTILVVPLLRYMLPVMGLLMVAIPGVWVSLRGRFGAPRPARGPRPAEVDG
jgi:4-amino-4-deoxy-L-arabinose transferase-like glycosyltransferase